MKIEAQTLDFLKKLSRHNNREWFLKNKETYLHAQTNAQQFLDALIKKMNEHDRIQTLTGKEALYRIYNDVRFSKDKTPYNPRFAGSLKRQKPQLRGGYYLWIKPGASRIGCGFTYPNPEDLLRIRKDISINYKDWKKILNANSLKNVWGEMQGEKVKTSPKGFAKEHPAIELLRYKQFWFERSFTDQEVLSEDFLKDVNTAFKKIRPLFDYASEILTTNLNGESVL